MYLLYQIQQTQISRLHRAVESLCRANQAFSIDERKTEGKALQRFPRIQ